MSLRCPTGCRLLAILLPLTLLPLSVRAQQGQVTGTVQSGSELPVASVSVQVVGTDAGTLTDQQGRYRLQVPAGEVELRASRIGFRQVTRTVTVEAGESVQVDFTLAREAVEMGGVVASVAASEATRREIGTDVVGFDAAEQVEQGAVNNLSDLLDGRTTGVSINQSSGTVGTAATVRVRGATSLTQDNVPIVYLDGIRVSNATGTGPGSVDFPNGATISRLDDLNPDDLARVQVLKGPTAAAAYGSEAAAGVLILETKEGGEQGPRITVRTEQGFTRDDTDYPDNYFNLTEFGGFTDIDAPVIQQWRPVQNPATGEIFARHNPLENPRQDPFQTGRKQRHNVAVRGGSGDGLTYYSSFQYEHDSGVFSQESLERYSLRANFGARPWEPLHVSVSTNYVNSELRLPDNDRSFFGMVGNGIAGFPGLSFGTLPDGSRGDCLETLVSGSPESVCERVRGTGLVPFEVLEAIRNEQDVERFIGSVVTTLAPVEWFESNLTVGIDNPQTKDYNLIPLDPELPLGEDSRGFVRDIRTTDQIITVDWTNTATIQLTDDLEASTTVGGQFVDKETESVGCTGDEFPSFNAISCDAAQTTTGFSNTIENAELGGYLQESLSYRNYVYLTGALRVDDNSAFGREQDPIVSPSLNTSLVLSDMPFWEVDAVDDLRLRFAWGKAAQAPAPFAQARTLRPVRQIIDGEQQTGLSPQDPGNPNLAPERNEEYEAGFDAELLAGRLGLSFTYFNQETTDAILSTTPPPSEGFPGARFVNIGAVANEGVEAHVNAEILDREEIDWSVDLTFSSVDPVVTELGDQPPTFFGIGGGQHFREGFAPGIYSGQVVAEAERDGEGNIIPGSVVLAPGNLGDENRPDLRNLGNPSPRNEQSLATTVTLFNNLSIHTRFDRAADFHVHNSTADFRNPFIPDQNGGRRYAFRQAESTPEEQAMMEGVGVDDATAVFVEEGDFVKWREVTVSYELPTAVVGLVGPVGSAQLTVGGRNLKTWTDYTGLDPELNFDGGRDTFAAGEFLTQPPPVSLYARLSVTF